MNDADAKKLFEEAVQRLDPGARDRLRMARPGASAGAARHPRTAWVPALAMAVVLGVGLAWWLPRAGAPEAPAPVAATGSAEVAEFAEAGDDAELYAWLAEAPVAAERDGGAL